MKNRPSLARAASLLVLAALLLLLGTWWALKGPGSTGSGAWDMAHGKVDRRAVEKAIQMLTDKLRPVVSAPQNVYAIEQGLIVFGPSHVLQNGRNAADLLIEQSTDCGLRDGGMLLVGLAPDKRLQRAPNQLVNTLVEAGFNRTSVFTLRCDPERKVTLERLIRDVLATTEMPSSADAGRAAFTLNLFVTACSIFGEPCQGTFLKLDGLRQLVLTALEKSEQKGISAEREGGFSLVQAIIRAYTVHPATPDEQKRIRRQLDVVLFRYEAERALVASAPSNTATAKLVLFSGVLQTLLTAMETSTLPTDLETKAKAQRVVADLVHVVPSVEFADCPPGSKEESVDCSDRIEAAARSVRALSQAIRTGIE